MKEDKKWRRKVFENTVLCGSPEYIFGKPTKEEFASYYKNEYEKIILHYKNKFED